MDVEPILKALWLHDLTVKDFRECLVLRYCIMGGCFAKREYSQHATQPRCDWQWFMSTLVSLRRRWCILKCVFFSNTILSFLKYKINQWHFFQIRVITQIAEPQSSWGQDIQANRADEGRAVGGGIHCYRDWGGGHAVALKTKDEFPGFVHVYSIPLHTLHYHRLR